MLVLPVLVLRVGVAAASTPLLMPALQLCEAGIVNSCL